MLILFRFSPLDPNARSYVGARGLMQLMPSTFAEIRTRGPELGVIDDPDFHIAAGIYHDRFLSQLRSRDIPEERRLASTNHAELRTRR